LFFKVRDDKYHAVAMAAMTMPGVFLESDPERKRKRMNDADDTYLSVRIPSYSQALHEKQSHNIDWMLHAQAGDVGRVDKPRVPQNPIAERKTDAGKIGIHMKLQDYNRK
jgi:hypothetical protein